MCISTSKRVLRTLLLGSHALVLSCLFLLEERIPFSKFQPFIQLIKLYSYSVKSMETCSITFSNIYHYLKSNKNLFLSQSFVTLFELVLFCIFIGMEQLLLVSPQYTNIKEKFLKLKYANTKALQLFLFKFLLKSTFIFNIYI